MKERLGKKRKIEWKIGGLEGSWREKSEKNKWQQRKEER